MCDLGDGEQGVEDCQREWKAKARSSRCGKHGAHMFLMEECLAKVQEAESSRCPIKGKERQREVPEVAAGPSEPNPFLSSHYNE